MKEYGSSKLLKTIIQQEVITNAEPPKKFKVNDQYKPSENIIISQYAQEDHKKEKKTLDDIIPIDPQIPVVETKKHTEKPVKKHEQTQESLVDDLQNINIVACEEYSHLRPVILGEIEEENIKQKKSFLQALRDGHCIIQLPNKLPFHDIGKTQKYVEEVKGDQAQKQLKDYYDECYDSSGIQLQKQFTNLSNKADVGIHIGKISIAADGSAIWKAGREEFEIVQGITQDLDQKCLIINKEDGKCGFIKVGEKFVITPNY
ncbi:unnamed protein product (macronuclear) [Paramecium tetraurelia]|uniref:Uncharacterized protein n=1 Tax=Paramecium tetraurelia TaxID=5888 RepID=A0CFC2_PARTE|nr:uncharacterized protein GSPATT00037928001 [Paramecium tetraurelia]CAK69489.1 unnamed protein product [Paramecium tetraurelia]|eukprot:XP_001436886.1 hypothetical protein (macronuclear) [Paramecium tetraurelia strain d4-2]